MVRTIMASVILAATCVSAPAQGIRMVGDWGVQSDQDRFSGATNVVAIRVVGARGFLLRCLDGKLSFAVKDFAAPFAGENDLIRVEFRADKNEVIGTLGEALDDMTAEIAVRA